MQKKAVLRMSRQIRRTKADSTLPTRRFSKAQETSVAKKLNGSTTVNSGATPYIKGDVLTEDFLIECKTKTTHSDSISIKKDWLEKIEKEPTWSFTFFNELFDNDDASYNYQVMQSDYTKLKQEIAENKSFTIKNIHKNLGGLLCLKFMTREKRKLTALKFPFNVS